jgi:hypothetical protein
MGGKTVPKSMRADRFIGLSIFASFLPCAPDSVYTDPGKMPENISLSPHSACFDLTLGCILFLTRPVLVRKDLAQGALKSKSQCNPAITA